MKQFSWWCPGLPYITWFDRFLPCQKWDTKEIFRNFGIIWQSMPSFIINCMIIALRISGNAHFSWNWLNSVVYHTLSRVEETMEDKNVKEFWKQIVNKQKQVENKRKKSAGLVRPSTDLHLMKYLLDDEKRVWEGACKAVLDIRSEQLVAWCNLDQQGAIDLAANIWLAGLASWLWCRWSSWSYRLWVQERQGNQLVDDFRRCMQSWTLYNAFFTRRFPFLDLEKILGENRVL